MRCTKASKWLSAVLIIAAMGPTISCGKGQEQSPTPTSITTAIPTATVTEGYPIPSDFNTYYDSTRIFNISYPTGWHVASDLLPYYHEILMKYINGSGSDTSAESGNAIFLAGTDTGLDYWASMSIVIGFKPANSSNIEELVDTLMQSSEVAPNSSSFNEISRVYTVIDGREAAIIECEPQGITHGLLMITAAGNLVWQVACMTSVSPDSFSAHEDDFQAIVHSLRIHY